MTDRGLPIVDGAPACPFVAFEDERDERSTRPDHRHRCYAERQPAARALAHQDAFCLSPAFPACPTFQDWARREAAAARPPSRTVREQVARPNPRRGREAWAAPPPWLASDAGAPEDSAGDAERMSDVGAADADAAAAEAWADDVGDLVAERGRGWDGEPSAEPVAPAFLAGTRPAVSPTPAPTSGRRPLPDEPPRPLVDAVAPSGSRSGPGAGLAASAAAWLGELPESLEDDEDESAADELVPRGVPGRVPRRAMSEAGAPSGARRASEDRPVISRGRTSGGYRRERDDGDRDRDRSDRDRADRDRSERDRPDRAPSRTLRGPEWEEPYTHESYPTLRTPMRMPNLSRVALGFVALVAAAVVLFFVPPMLLKLGAGGDSSGATPAPSVGASSGPSASVAPTPVPSPTAQVYTVAQGDTLSRIAAKFGLTLQELTAANPQLKDPNKLAIGDQLTIPPRAPTSVPDASGVPNATTVPDASPSAP